VFLRLLALLLEKFSWHGLCLVNTVASRLWLRATHNACNRIANIGITKAEKLMKRKLLASLIGMALITGSSAFAAGVTDAMIEKDAQSV